MAAWQWQLRDQYYIIVCGFEGAWGPFQGSWVVSRVLEWDIKRVCIVLREFVRENQDPKSNWDQCADFWVQIVRDNY